MSLALTPTTQLRIIDRAQLTAMADSSIASLETQSKQEKENSEEQGRLHNINAYASASENSNSSCKVPCWLQKSSMFYIFHVGYFMLLVSLGTLALWVGADKHGHRIRFIDALYCSVSASTVTGLMSLSIENLHLIQQLVLLLLTVLGSQVLTSLLPLNARRVASSRILCNQGNIILAHFSFQKQPLQEDTGPIPEPTWKKITKLLWVRHVDVMAERIQALDKAFGKVLFAEEISRWKSEYLHYRALTYLNRIAVIYFCMVQFLGFLLIRIYLCLSPSASEILSGRKIDKTFFSLYNSVASFGNAGFTLLDSSMVEFRDHYFLLLLLGFLILLGNTMFPPCLWAIIAWLCRMEKKNFRREIYDYLLQNPRRCYTHLFPRIQTLWLMATVIGFNTIQIIFFCVLDWNSKALGGLGPEKKMVNVLFQTSATRNAGSNVVQLSQLSPAMLVLFLGLMAVSVYPVYLSRQKTRALKQTDMESYESQISVQSRKLLARDSAHIFIVIFLLCIIEDKNLTEDPLNYSLFNMVFEVISGFGNVGLSVGYDCSLAKGINSCSNVPYSLSGKWNSGGKLLMAVTMFLGRHRGLPDSVDSALILPSINNSAPT